MSKYFIILSCLIGFLCSCNSPKPHYEIKSDILLKDKVYLTIKTDFIVDTPEALKEVRYKSDQLAFALRLALRDHPSTQLKGRGRGAVLNAWKSIARQVLDHPVAEIKITTYEFHLDHRQVPL